MDESTTAVGIDVFNEEQILQITWEDGETSRYPLYGLRKNCPCVMCRGGHENMQIFQPQAFFLQNPPRMNIKSLQAVGNHALQITWVDGHNSGMYRWETLRWLDPVNHK
jgi:DUF971 family protein